MSQKYYGTIAALKKGFKLAQIKGRWASDGNEKHTFYSDTGGILNWCPSTKTIQFQGRERGKEILEGAYEDLLLGDVYGNKPIWLQKKIARGLLPTSKCQNFYT